MRKVSALGNPDEFPAGLSLSTDVIGKKKRVLQDYYKKCNMVFCL